MSHPKTCRTLFVLILTLFIRSDKYNELNLMLFKKSLLTENQPVQICIEQKDKIDLYRFVLYDNLNSDKILTDKEVHEELELEFSFGKLGSRFQFCTFQISDVFKTRTNRRPLILLAGDLVSNKLGIGTEKYWDCNYHFDLKDWNFENEFENENTDVAFMVNNFIAPMIKATSQRCIVKHLGTSDQDPTKIKLELEQKRVI